MTREEAINKIRNGSKYGHSAVEAEGLIVALEALELITFKKPICDISFDLINYPNGLMIKVNNQVVFTTEKKNA